ncbi:MAG TPA: hypothetical protein VL688_12350 [Verrucomicrobiae bacterium]|nr:hypothetical protein [Verrucomicrobiae bacterium]
MTSSSQSNPNGSSSWKVFAYIAVPAALAFLLILKVFLISGCFAFDANDDAGYTFLSLAAARHVLRQGALPLLNLYHAFGTPIPGDCLTFPFAPQAVTYAFLPGKYAMTVNRFVLAWITVAVLTLYYRRRLPHPWASFCAVLAFLTPGALWNFAHHHYQTALLFSAALLLFEERFIENGKKRDAVFFYAAAVLMIQSLSMMIVLIAVFFSAANAFFEAGKERRPRALRIAALLAAAFVFQIPEVLSFLAQAAGSLRASSGFGIEIPPRRMLAGILGGLTDFRHLHEAWIYFPLPLMAAVAAGWKKTGRGAVKILTLGVLPLFGVTVLLMCQRLYWAIPYLKSTDITRFWWVSNIFLMAAPGAFFAGLKERTVRQAALFASAVFAGFLLSQLAVDYRTLDRFVREPVFIFTVLAMAYAAFLALGGEAKAAAVSKIFSALMALTVLAALYPVVRHTLGFEDLKKCRVSHWFSDAADQDYALQPLVPFLQPGSRITHEAHMVYRHDAKVNANGLFGAQPVTPLHYRPFDEYLIGRGLVQKETDTYGLGQYHFIQPWRADALRDLGIRYVVQGGRNPQAESEGWKNVTNYAVLSLYENPRPVSLAYLEEGSSRTALPQEAIRFRRNGLEAALPALEREEELVAAFAARPGWKARVDGNLRALDSAAGEAPLLRVKVGPGNHAASFDYEPFSLGQVLLCAILSLGILGLALRRAS